MKKYVAKGDKKIRFFPFTIFLNFPVWIALVLLLYCLLFGWKKKEMRDYWEQNNKKRESIINWKSPLTHSYACTGYTQALETKENIK